MMTVMVMEQPIATMSARLTLIRLLPDSVVVAQLIPTLTVTEQLTVTMAARLIQTRPTLVFAVVE